MQYIIDRLKYVLDESLKTYSSQQKKGPNVLLPLHAGFLESSLKSTIFDLKEEHLENTSDQNKRFVEQCINRLEKLLKFANITSKAYADSHPSEKQIFKAGYLQSGIVQIIISANFELEKEDPYEYVDKRAETIKQKELF